MVRGRLLVTLLVTLSSTEHILWRAHSSVSSGGVAAFPEDWMGSFSSNPEFEDGSTMDRTEDSALSVSTVQNSNARMDESTAPEKEEDGEVHDHSELRIPPKQVMEGATGDEMELDWPWSGHKNKTDNSCASNKDCSSCASSSWECHWCEKDDACHAKASVHGCSIGMDCQKKDKKNETDHSCHAYEDCSTCSSSSWECHWCEKDGVCHAKGSVYGCTEGMNCNKEKKNETDKSCASHHDCSPCALSSWGCHWCAHDNACHTKGSMYGCTVGVDCYSADRCMRTKPDPLDKFVFTGIGPLPLFIILFLAGTCLCCSTLCFALAGGIKGAYEDLAHMASTNPAYTNMANPDRDTESPSNVMELTGISVQQDGLDDDADFPEDEGEGEATAPAVRKKEWWKAPNPFGSSSISSKPSRGGYMPLSPGGLDDGPEFSVSAMSQLHESSAPNTRNKGSTHMSCLYNACRICYLLTVFIVGFFAFFSVRYFPKIPDYNVCSDGLAWKSIVDSLTSLKVEASFEILVSVENPNHLDIVLDLGKGTFYHADAFVGTFSIPTSTIAAMSISDVLIVATFSPDRWEALSLTSEYYKGTLKFLVNSQATVRIPSLANYAFESKISNMIVQVNDPKLDDRHLCACPQWKDFKNHSQPSFLLAID
eukprot:CAMPEP_0198282462 /NCGR_PEP_ID=MMETSP1449-20131203/2271_1 /TAXON_ID=420275 /ORGANISM="Attheya septentrionalis, Strain CCMP2084" /LENGTH=651 /DNA_ID=CAMNT_0043978727 /DNA_START=149 /DNA_END=2104 /DNA_ORIENTATION=+